MPIVLDAAYAVILGDLLEDADLDLLLAPWEEVVGSPFGDRPDVADARLDEADELAPGDEWQTGDDPPDEGRRPA